MSKLSFFYYLHIAIGNRNILNNAADTNALLAVNRPPSSTNVMYEASWTRNGAEIQDNLVNC